MNLRNRSRAESWLAEEGGWDGEKSQGGGWGGMEELRQKIKKGEGVSLIRQKMCERQLSPPHYL